MNGYSPIPYAGYESQKEYWRVAIGLNEVDDLKPSEYLNKLSEENAAGKLADSEVVDALKKYYESGQGSTSTRECDFVATRIKELLEDNVFTLRPNTMASIHRYLFQDLEDFSGIAGVYRTSNIAKAEPVLAGRSVNYTPWQFIADTLEYDLGQARTRAWSSLQGNDLITAVCDLTSAVWQVHPFYEGNTRTTAVLIEKLLRSLGYNLDNEPFAQSAKYFRDALVLDNFSDPDHGISPNRTYLQAFFEKLLQVEGQHGLPEIKQAYSTTLETEEPELDDEPEL
ncbi:MAG: Fic family protein [Actinomycetes bacterium]|nr:Fic family protein [Actinomycetes bacterium]